MKNNERLPPLQCTIAETGRLLSFSERTVYRLLQKGKLKSTGRGKLRRVTYRSILGYQGDEEN